MVMLMVVLGSACTSESPSMVSGSGTASPQPTPALTPTPTPIVSSSVSPAPSEEPAEEEITVRDLNQAAAAWLENPPLDPGTRREFGAGRIPGGGRWIGFLYAREEGVGISIQIDGEVTKACCLARLWGDVLALMYVDIGDGQGVVLAQVAPQVEQIRYECFQCGTVDGEIPRHINGRFSGLPQIGVIIVTANADGGNDGFLTAFTGRHVFERDRLRLPPLCAGGSCGTGLAWGVLVSGTETMFDS